MVYPYLNFAVNRSAPRFPTPPAKRIVMQNMPNDLIANGRNYYTEIMFRDYRSGVFGVDGIQKIASSIGGGIGSLIDAGTALSTGPLTGSFLPSPSSSSATPGTSSSSGSQIGSSVGNSIANFLGSTSFGAIRLPLPNSINDITTLHWEQRSFTSDAANLINPNLARAGSIALGAAGASVGKTLNPLLYATFNRPDFREFRFEWILAPRTRVESQTLKNITCLRYS